jgi:hypothetical protein
MKYLFSFAFILIFFSSALKSQIQDTSGVVTVETRKKEFFSGELIVITTDSIFIRNEEDGRLALSKKNIKSIRNGLKPKHFSETTNSSVPYYVQTAMPNGEGNHYYKNYYVLGNEFNYGLTDQFNLSLGFETGTLIFDSANQLPLIQLGAKYGYSTQKHIHIGVSTKYYFNSDGSILMINSPITFGSKRTNFTLSPNVIFQGGSDLIGIFMNLSLGLSDRSRFVVDYGYIDETSISAIVYEYLFKSGFSLSLGAMVSNDVAIPNLSFSVPFGRWKR